MPPDFEKAFELTGTTIGASMRCASRQSLRLIESISACRLSKEPEIRGLRSNPQKQVKIEYKGFASEEPLRFDLLIADCVLINFNQLKLTRGVHHMLLPGAGR